MTATIPPPAAAPAPGADGITVIPVDAACPAWCTTRHHNLITKTGITVTDEGYHHGDTLAVTASTAPGVEWITGLGADVIEACIWQPGDSAAAVVTLTHADHYLPDLTPGEAEQLARILHDLAAQARAATT